MPAPKEILDLVVRFELHHDAYKSGQYNETQLRRDFLDPFFKALGWDIDNSSGHAEAYRDVIHEDAVRVGDAMKAPDYSFRVGGQRKFFLEAKKPSVRIKEEIAPAFQLRRYAWSAKLPLSVLSDFEEFAIYDCRFKPIKTDKASVGRVFYCTYREFAEKWDHIASIFSKDAVLKGSFDKFAESNKAKRGTSEVDAAFLAEIERWRSDLASNLALRNKSLSQRELNFAVQRIIDRVIFLRICEDRGIEPYQRLHGLADKPGIYARLCDHFRAADDRYNSGLFHFRSEKNRHEEPDELTLRLEVDDKLLRDMLRGLYYPDSPYEFSVLSADILGQVYEQFLGKVIRLTEGHRAAIDEKPEVRKAGGVFYTPTYIVDYIVRETVGKLLDDCGRRREEAEPSGAAGNPPRHLGGYEPRAAAAVLERVSRLRILDPACGSGSFLIGAYEFLLDWHLRFYLANSPGEWAREKKARKGSKGQHPALVQTRNGGWQLGIAERKRILLNNIYGVDLDSQAVEVTKLSLLLKVLEGEAVQAQMSLGLLDRVLPDLGDNIKCGNSLIGPDFYQQDELPTLTDDDRYRLNVFDWRHEFAEIFRDGGFDAVIGNPPYVRQESLSDVKGYLERHYEAFDGVADLYAYFMEKGVQLLRNGGVFSIIVSSSFLRANFGEPLRRTLKRHAAVLRIVDFGGLPVFASAKDTYVCVPLLAKGEKQGRVDVSHVTSLKGLKLPEHVASQHYSIPHDRLAPESWSLKSDAEMAVFQKVMKAGQPLGEYVEKRFFRGVTTGLNEAFVIDTPTKLKLIAKDKRSAELIHPLLGGEDIRRYRFNDTGLWLVFTRRGVDIDRYPAIKAHLENWKEDLMPKLEKTAKRGRKPGRYEWYEIQDDVAYFEVFDRPKIIFPDICKGPRFSLDTGASYLANTAYCLGTDDLYLLGFLNSRLFWFAIANISIPFGIRAGEYRYRLIYQYMEQVPVRVIHRRNKSDQAAHDQIVKLVETMLELHRKLAAAQTPQEKTGLERQIAATDAQIDLLVYQLYGLTESEIALVEGRAVPECQPEELPVPVASAATPQSEADAAHFFAKEEPPPYKTSP